LYLFASGKKDTASIPCAQDVNEGTPENHRIRRSLWPFLPVRGKIRGIKEAFSKHRFWESGLGFMEKAGF
jgi:hypothetical protein